MFCTFTPVKVFALLTIACFKMQILLYDLYLGNRKTTT